MPLELPAKAPVLIASMYAERSSSGTFPPNSLIYPCKVEYISSTWLAIYVSKSVFSPELALLLTNIPAAPAVFPKASSEDIASVLRSVIPAFHDSPSSLYA